MSMPFAPRLFRKQTPACSTRRTGCGLGAIPCVGVSLSRLRELAVATLTRYIYVHVC